MRSAQNGTDDDVIVVTEDDLVDSPRSAADSPRDGAEDLPGDQSLESDSDQGLDAGDLDVADERIVDPSGGPAPVAAPAGATPGRATPAGATPAGAAPENVVQASANWPEIQATFVDDPRLAVQQAAEVTGAALSALVAAAREREQALRQGWQADGAGTEELRTTLRHYRELSTRLVTLSQGL